MSNLADLFASEPVEKKTTGSDILVRHQSVDEIFDEIPVGLDVFIKDSKFLGEKYLKLSPKQQDAVKHIERVFYMDTYPQLAEYDSYWAESIRMTNYHVAQWGKSSKAPYSLVYDAKTGQWEELSKFNEGLVASAVTQSGQIQAEPSSEGWYEGYGSMFRVTTASGLVSDVYEGHKFLTYEKYSSRTLNRKIEWKKLKDLTIGSHVAIPSTLPEPVELCDIDSRVIELVGLWLGDGCMPKNRADKGPSLSVGYQSPLTKKRYEDLVRSFGCNITYQDNGRAHELTATYGKRKNIKNPVREIAFNYELDGKNAYSKRVPRQFFSLSNEKIALFISRLIDTDGWVCISNTCEIGYGSVSRGLVEDIRKLMLRLGVVAEVKKKNTQYKGEPYTSYQLRVRRRDMVDKLASQLVLLDKSSKLDQVREHNKVPSRRIAMHGDLMWDRISSIEYIGEGEYWTVTVPTTSCFVSDGFLDHNSGKDTISRISALRIAYMLMCLKSPQEYFQMAQDDTIHMLNVAISAEQAQRAYFEPLTKMVNRGWFKDRANPTKNAVEFDKGIQSLSGHSKTDSQEGLNIILGVCDEIDGFKTKDELARTHAASVRESSNSAEAIMEMIQTSANSRFPETFKFVAISWPRYVGSTVQALTDDYKKDIEQKGKNSVYYASGPYATWEVRTDRFRSQFNPQYERDARTAAAKYECKPSFSINPYFRNDPAVRECMYKPDQTPVEVHYENDGYVWKPVYEFADDFYPVVGAVYSMHADLAVRNDRAGIAMCHQARIESRDKDIFEEDGTLHRVTEHLPFIKADFVISYEADLVTSPPREIQIQWALDLWQELKNRGFNVRQFSYDGYQSTQSRQTLESLGVSSPLISTDRSEEPWKGLRDLLYMGRISIPHDDLLLGELLGLTKKENGKVDHQAGKSKDMADALACSAVGALQLGGQEDKSGARAWYAPPEFVAFTHEVDIMEGKTLEHLQWGTNTHEPVGAFSFDLDSGLF